MLQPSDAAVMKEDSDFNAQSLKDEEFENDYDHGLGCFMKNIVFAHTFKSLQQTRNRIA